MAEELFMFKIFVIVQGKKCPGISGTN